MQSLLELMLARRSVRKYSTDPIKDEKLETILRAGLLAPSGHSKYPLEFILVKDKETLEKMSHCRVGAAKMLTGAAAAIAVVADIEKSDVWVEDASVSMMGMHLMATELGLGSCWIQVRLREAEDGRSSEEYLRELLKFPSNYQCQAILSIGEAERPSKPHELSKLKVEKIHRETF